MKRSEWRKGKWEAAPHELVWPSTLDYSWTLLPEASFNGRSPVGKNVIDGRDANNKWHRENGREEGRDWRIWCKGFTAPSRQARPYRDVSAVKCCGLPSSLYAATCALAHPRRCCVRHQRRCAFQLPSETLETYTCTCTGVAVKGIRAPPPPRCSDIVSEMHALSRF